MKKEELDSLREKYFMGNTSLDEERLLKELENDEYFTALKQPTEKMDWDFESFVEKTYENQDEIKATKIIPLKRRIILLSSIAASLMIGFFFVQKWMLKDNVNIAPTIASQSSDSKKIVNKPTEDVILYNDIENKVEIDLNKVVNKTVLNTSVKKVAKKTSIIEEVEKEDVMYVEINGVRIYDEEKALEVTETALQLATTNLKKGLEEVENIKYLKIEI